MLVFLALATVLVAQAGCGGKSNPESDPDAALERALDEGGAQPGLVPGLATDPSASGLRPSNRTPPSAEERALAEQYRPVLVMADDDYRPKEVSIGLDLAILRQHVEHHFDLEILKPVKLESLCQHHQQFHYLDFLYTTPTYRELRKILAKTGEFSKFLAQITDLSDAQDDSVIKETLKKVADKVTQTAVYARVASFGDKTYVQYWFYYYYNAWLNEHEGDWEMITIAFPSPDVRVILADGIPPEEVAYSAHQGGNLAAWDHVERDKDGQRPLVYVAKGSHANYLSAGKYYYRVPGGIFSLSKKFAADEATGKDHVRDYELKMLPASEEAVAGEGDDCGEARAVLDFEGRWGQTASVGCVLGCDGPTGPAQKPAWKNPGAWIEQLRGQEPWTPCRHVLRTKTNCHVIGDERRVGDRN